MLLLHLMLDYVKGVKRQYDCWEWRHEVDENAVHGLITTPQADDRPNTFYFGQLDDDWEACAAQCAAETQCHVRACVRAAATVGCYWSLSGCRTRIHFT